MLNRGADMVAAKLLGAACVPITYVVGSSSLEIDAVVGSTSTETDDGDGLVMRSQMRDYLIDAAALSIDGDAFEPSRGHQIIDGVMRYEVLPVGSEGCWRWSDRDHKRYRIHTRWLGKVDS